MYTADPRKDPQAKRFSALSYKRALVDNLAVMDASAMAMARDNNQSIRVFGLEEPGNVTGERNVRLGDLPHRDRGLHAGGLPFLLEEVLQRQAVHDGAKHAHVVAGMALDNTEDKPRRVLLKLSGEAFGGGHVGVDTGVVRRIASEIVPAVAQGVQVAIVTGGGRLP